MGYMKPVISKNPYPPHPYAGDGAQSYNVESPKPLKTLLARVAFTVHGSTSFNGHYDSDGQMRVTLAVAREDKCLYRTLDCF